MKAMLQTVQDQAENGELDELSEFMEEHDTRAQDMWWKETDDGLLYVAPTRLNPDAAMQIQLQNGNVKTATVDEPRDIDWNNLPTTHEPNDGVRDRQFD